MFVSGKHQDSREKKTNWFPEGPYIKCFVIYLDFALIIQQKETNKDGMRVTTVQLYPARDTFEFDQWHVYQQSTNHGAHFVE